jgi:CRISPR system Cascade subunit CasB
MQKPPDFVERFEKLTRGQQAELRRVAKPDDVIGVPAFYRLFPGECTDPREKHRRERIAFLLPWAPKHIPGAESLGRQLAKKDVSEARVYQVIRAKVPNDLIQLRRLVQHIEPKLDWMEFGKTLFFWGNERKRRLLEDFFIASSAKSTD